MCALPSPALDSRRFMQQLPNRLEGRLIQPLESDALLAKTQPFSWSLYFSSSLVWM